VSKQKQELRAILANRQWIRRTHPFPHVIATNVFAKSFYRELEAEFQSFLRRTFGPSTDRTPPMYRMAGYGAFATNFRADCKWPFRMFLSREWHDLVAAVAGVDATGEVDCSLHHHKVGSRNGQVHNDLNPGWFLNEPDESGMTVTNNARCTYCHGDTFYPGDVAIERVRGVALLLYLNNAPWRAGDGGETGLYYSEYDPVERPVVRVAPMNNTMLIFECTPFSYHSFLKNDVHPRNSLIMWLHRSKSEVAARWGEDKIVGWSKDD
jgi:hypothetical protein